MKNLRNNNIAVLISIAIPLVVIFGFMLFEFYAVATGDKVALIVQGYDPTDFLRGHYIRYDIFNNMTDDVTIADPENAPYSEDGNYYNENGFITFVDTNNDGAYDSFGEFYWKRPNTPYIKATYNYYERRYVDKAYVNFSLDYHQDRYYLDENLASFVESEINSANEFLICGTVKSGYFRASHIEVKGVIY